MRLLPGPGLLAPGLAGQRWCSEGLYPSLLWGEVSAPKRDKRKDGGIRPVAGCHCLLLPRPSAAQRGGRKPGPARSGRGTPHPQPRACSPPTCRVLPEDLRRRYASQKPLARQTATRGCVAFKTTCPAACLTDVRLAGPWGHLQPNSLAGGCRGCALASAKAPTEPGPLSLAPYQTTEPPWICVLSSPGAQGSRCH